MEEEKKLKALAKFFFEMTLDVFHNEKKVYALRPEVAKYNIYYKLYVFIKIWMCSDETKHDIPPFMTHDDCVYLSKIVNDCD